MRRRWQHWFTVTMLLLSAPSSAATPMLSPPSVLAEAREVQWVAHHAVPVGIETAPVGPVEGAAILKAMRGAHVIGFGELTHGAHEPLVQRNRWIRFLIEKGGVTGVAVESGLAQSRRVNDYVLGASDDPSDVVREGFTWTFGDYPANIALVTWLRRWNDAHPARKVRFYGADVTGGDAADGMSRAPFVLAEVDRYLARAMPGPSQALRDRMTPLASRFDERAWHKFTPAEQSEVKSIAHDVVELLDINRTHAIAATSEDAFAWGRQMAADIGRLLPIFETWPVDDPNDMKRNLRVVNLRDRAMADYVLWAEGRERRRGGRLLSFAANGHTAKTNFTYKEFAGLSDIGQNMGGHLFAALGPAYRVVLTVASSDTPDFGEGGSVNAIMQAAVKIPYLVSLHDGKPSRWWATTQSFVRPPHQRLTIAPIPATDVLLYLGVLTDEPRSNALIAAH